MRRVIAIAFACLFTFTAVALAYPPAIVTDVTQDSLKIAGLDCGTQYRIQVEERNASNTGWTSVTSHTPTTAACPAPAQPPVANFSATPSPAVWGQPVQLASTGTCADGPCTYRWFHGGATSTDEIEASAAQPNTQASVTFTKNPYWLGPASITLRVTDASGDVDTETKSFPLTDLATPPPPQPPPPPPSSGYPDASNTGPTGTLTASTGNVTISTAGTVLENRQINGCVTVAAPNVTIRNSRVVCNGQSAIWSGSTGLVIEDTEVDCGNAEGRTAITPARYTARRVDASRCENIFWAGGDVLIEDSYIHDPIPCCTGSNPHTDSIQVPGGASNITIRHNRVYGGYLSQSNFGNSAITTGGGVSNFLVENNILAGGGYTLRCEGSGANTNYRILNNRFSRVYVSSVGGFGPVNGCTGGSSWPAATAFIGNIYHETGVPIG